MSDMIDRNVLKAKMYQEAFESDTDMQKWDSGCWIRYKLFEKVVDSTPTVPYGPRWHRVEEPPKYTARYVVWCGVNWYGEGMHGDFMTANYNTVSGRWSVDCDRAINGPLIGDILYWMPIEPPKEDA